MLSPRHISPLPPIAPHCEEQDVVSNEAAHNTIVLHPLPPLSMHQGQDDTIMATTSDTITKLASQLIEPLDTRAKALANGAQFDLALRDAAMMRALAPTSALGYLRAGSIYQQQGHQQAAMNMYKQGLMAVDPTNPWYSRLKTSYAAALEVQEKRVDFMSKLPADIVSMAIIPLLFESYELRQDTVCPHFNVCRTWCQRILANNAFHFLLHDGGCVDDPAYDLLPYSPHFKTLTVAHRQDWVEILNERPWTRLSHLNVDCKGQPQLLVNVFGSIGSTLTHLNLLSHRQLPHLILSSATFQKETPIALRHILDGCPNLVSLEGTLIVNESPTLLSTEYPKLIHLHVKDWSTESRSYDNMVNLLAHLPSLVSLNVFPRPDMKLLPMIHQYGPNLKLLVYGGNESCCLSYDDEHQQQGLEKVCIGHSRDVYNGDDLISMLVQHCGSLKALRLVGRITGNNMTLEGSNIGFKRLEKLEVNAQDHSLVPLTTSIICRAPYLHTIFNDALAYQHEDFFNAATNLRHLKALLHCGSPINAHNFTSLFNIISSLEKVRH